MARGHEVGGAGRLGWRAAFVTLMLGSSLVMMVSVVGYMAMSFSQLSSTQNSTATASASMAAPWIAQ